MKSKNGRAKGKEAAIQAPVSGRAGESERTAAVRERVRAVIADGMSQSQVAAEADISASTLSMWLAENYPGNEGNVTAKLERWLDARGELLTVQAIVPDLPTYFPSRSSQDVMKSLRIAQSMELMTLIVGIPGVGKSTSCREYQHRAPNVWVATLASHTTGVVPVLKEISEAVGAGKASGANGMAREIVRKVRGRQGLLIIDECHHASLQALDAIRALHDETQVGVALVGGPELTGKVERMAQLHSRIGLPLYLLRPLKEDVESLLDAWTISDREARRTLTTVAKRPGALRAATQVLRLATSLARSAGEPLQNTHVADAAEQFAARTTHGGGHV